MPLFTNILRAASVVAIATVVGLEPALAGGGCPPPGVPAPLVGAGIPALIAFAGGYWAIRKRRKR
jgi:hypothetical protein